MVQLKGVDIRTRRQLLTSCTISSAIRAKTLCEHLTAVKQLAALHCAVVR